MSVEHILKLGEKPALLRKTCLRRPPFVRSSFQVATVLGQPTRSFLLAVSCLLPLTTNRLSAETSAASSRKGPSNVLKIQIIDAWVEPPEKPVRRGSVEIKVEGSAHVFLHSIKCVGGSVAHVFFPDARVDGLSALVDRDIDISPPGLSLRPGAALNMSPDKRPAEYIDSGHLVFSGGANDGSKPRKPLKCLFDFSGLGTIGTSFKPLDNIEELIKF